MWYILYLVKHKRKSQLIEILPVIGEKQWQQAFVELTTCAP